MDSETMASGMGIVLLVYSVCTFATSTGYHYLTIWKTQTNN